MYLTDGTLPLHIELDRSGTGRGPLMLLLHGFTGHMEEPHLLAVRDAALQAGCSVLRAELFGHGQSGGAFRDHTLFRWLTNTLTLAEYAGNLDFVTDLYLCGHSQGGLTVMLAGAMLRDRVRGLIPLSPAWNIPADARAGNLLGRRFDPFRIPAEIPVDEDLVLGGNYIRAAQSIYVEQTAFRFEGPVLVVHGTGDMTIPFSWGERAARLYPRGELAVIDGDTHCYDRHPDRAARAVFDWLRERGEEAG